MRTAFGHAAAPTILTIGLVLSGCVTEAAVGPVTDGTEMPGQQARLVFTALPTTVVANATIDPPIEVTIQDATGNTVTEATDAVTVAIETNPAGGTLSGTTTVSAVNGVATFDDLSIDKIGNGYKLVATSGTLTSGESATFDATVSVVTKLEFTVQPTDAPAYFPIAPTVEVAITYPWGDTVTDATDAVTLAIELNVAGGTLSGTTTVDAVNGVATFNDLSVDKVGSGYTLVATSGALSSASSASFDIYLTLAFASVSTGDTHTCGITTSGTAYCWGDHGLRSSGTHAMHVPVRVPGGHEFASVSAGGMHTCGVTTSGVAYCWDYNYYGQLGDGSTSSSDVPVPVAGGHTFHSVSTGWHHTCGVTTGGTVYCWGENTHGQLGSIPPSESCGRFVCSLAPVRVGSQLTFASVSAGPSYTCANTGSGDGHCWGNNGWGQRGDGLLPDGPDDLPLPKRPYYWEPRPIAGGQTFAVLSAGGRHTCATTTTGFLYCWGANAYGELAIATTQTSGSCAGIPCLNEPQLSLARQFAAVSAGGYHTCAVTADGAAYCWGSNSEGQLGDGCHIDADEPVPVLGGLTFESVSAGQAHTCGITEHGAAYCWGNNSYGQLGAAVGSPSAMPIRVTGAR